MNAFDVVEIPSGGEYILSLSEKFHEIFPSYICSTSYSVLAARLLGMNYIDYCKYLAVNGAELRNKKGYPIAYFKNKEDAAKICEMINKQYLIFKKKLEE